MNNNKNLNIQAELNYIISQNDRVVDEANVLANYSGDKLNILGESSDKIIIVQLTNDDIMKLLSIPSSKLSLNERLRLDYPIKTRKSKQTKHKKKRKKRRNTRKRKVPTITTLIGSK